MKRLTPLEALVGGAIAGIVGALAQDLFFIATRRIAPSAPGDRFDPPEREQKDEQATETVARRFVEQLAQRGPIEHRALGARLVHYGFGAAWGSLYGIVAASNRRRDPLASGCKFGVLVWSLADNVVLPAFKLSAWPTRYPLRNHAYAVLAHLAYGGTVAIVFHALPRATDRGDGWSRAPQRLVRAARHSVRSAVTRRLVAAAVELPRPLLRPSAALAVRVLS